MNHYNFNGKILPESTPSIGPDNRGLRYGDGLFETIKYKNGSLILLDEHLSRLWNGMQLLQFEIPRLFTPELLEAQILQLIRKNGLRDARVRLSVIRGNGGLYDAPNQPLYIIQCWQLANDLQLNANGLAAGIYTDAKKTRDKFANCKHNNFLPYIMGALFAKKNRFNDAVILNDMDRVCDSTIANIFIIKEGMVMTPPLSEGCIAGVMRKFVIQALASAFPVQETEITTELLLNADEVFLTNSMYNMRWVASINDTRFKNEKTTEIFNFLSETNPAVFC